MATAKVVVAVKKQAVPCGVHPFGGPRIFLRDRILLDELISRDAPPEVRKPLDDLIFPMT